MEITEHLRDLRESIYQCITDYYEEKLPTMITNSVNFHKKVNRFLRLMRSHKKPLDENQKKIRSKILEVMNTAYNHTMIYSDTNIGYYEEQGIIVLRDDKLALSSF